MTRSIGSRPDGSCGKHKSLGTRWVFLFQRAFLPSGAKGLSPHSNFSGRVRFRRWPRRSAKREAGHLSTIALATVDLSTVVLHFRTKGDRSRNRTQGWIIYHFHW